MNCREGDLAIVIFSLAGNLGKIVRCVEYHGETFWRHQIHLGMMPCWRIDRPLMGVDGTRDYMIADHQLRPIRDPGDDAQDESLSWKKVPSTDRREELA